MKDRYDGFNIYYPGGFTISGIPIEEVYKEIMFCRTTDGRKMRIVFTGPRHKELWGNEA